MKKVIAIILISCFLLSCKTGFSGRFKNGEYVYDIKSDGTYSFIELKLNLDGLSENERMLTDYDKLPREDSLIGSGTWKIEGRNLDLDGPGLASSYLINGNSLCTEDIIKGGEVCYDKQ